MIVMKFGGSSVADREQLLKVLEIVKSRLARRPVVVCSAHKGMTDRLVRAARNAVGRHFELPDVIDVQQEIAASLACPPDFMGDLYQEFHDLMRGISLVRELSPRSLDYMMSFGERMSVRCIAHFFQSQGLKAQAYDIWDLGFITDANFGAARPLPGYEEWMRRAFAEKVPPDVVPIVTGFVGKTREGDVTTVGRNGSDLTATLVGAALNAEEVEIWTDTDGVMTSDPSVVKAARNIPQMRFDEAAELAHFGGRVLHPSTLLPAMEKGIPVRVLNTNRPDHPGTVIDQQGGQGPAGGLASIAYMERQAVLTITTTRMLAQAGFLAQVFAILARQGVVVDVISTSEISVSLTTGNLAQLETALPDLGQLGECRVITGKTVLVVVGRDLAQERRQVADILEAVASAGVRIDMLSLGLGSINFSMVIDDADIDKAVSTLHRMLFEDAA
ncbi:MAG: aspartate kinase [Thermodesulfobacteriota bacterium]